MMLNEKRNFFRLPVEIPVKVDYTTADSFISSCNGRGLIRNLSGGGIRLEMNEKLPQNSQVNLSFSLPYNNPDLPVQDFYLNGEITRATQANSRDFFSYGVRFLDILPPVQDRIVQYLFNRQIALRVNNSTRQDS